MINIIYLCQSPEWLIAVGVVKWFVSSLWMMIITKWRMSFCLVRCSLTAIPKQMIQAVKSALGAFAFFVESPSMEILWMNLSFQDKWSSRGFSFERWSWQCRAKWKMVGTVFMIKIARRRLRLLASTYYCQSLFSCNYRKSNQKTFSRGKLRKTVWMTLTFDSRITWKLKNCDETFKNMLFPTSCN